LLFFIVTNSDYQNNYVNIFIIRLLKLHHSSFKMIYEILTADDEAHEGG